MLQRQDVVTQHSEIIATLQAALPVCTRQKINESICWNCAVLLLWWCDVTWTTFYRSDVILRYLSQHTATQVGHVQPAMLTRPQPPWPRSRPWPSRPRPQSPKPRPKPRMSENTTAIIWLKCGTVYLAKHLEISSNSYIQRITHIQMLVPRCHTSPLHFKYTSVFSNESDMRAKAKANAMKAKASSHWPQAKAKD